MMSLLRIKASLSTCGREFIPKINIKRKDTITEIKYKVNTRFKRNCPIFLSCLFKNSLQSFFVKCSTLLAISGQNKFSSNS